MNSTYVYLLRADIFEIRENICNTWGGLLFEIWNFTQWIK